MRQHKAGKVETIKMADVKKRHWRGLLVMMAAVVALAVGFVWFKAPPGGIATVFSKVDFQVMKGKWLRPDGGYVLDIRSVAADGKMDAGYYNPRPIHVARAEARTEGGVGKVFVELRDVNYPGSTYTLTYDPKGDCFNGVYYQAAIKQSFDVVFTRIK